MAPLVQQLCSVNILAKAFEWAAANSAKGDVAAGQTFNISNGDFLLWESVYPRVAALFGAEAGPPEPQRLEDTMPPLAAVYGCTPP